MMGVNWAPWRGCICRWYKPLLTLMKRILLPIPTKYASHTSRPNSKKWPRLRRTPGRAMAKGGNDSRRWYGRGDSWTLAGEYGKFCTIPPTAHLISSSWQSAKCLSVSYFLLEKKKSLQNLWGKIYWFKMSLSPSNLYIKNPLIPTFFSLRRLLFLSPAVLPYGLVVRK